MEKEKNKAKFKKLKVFLGILLTIVVLIAGIVAWQWNNIVSVMYFLNYSENDLEQMDKENKKQLDEVMKKLQIEELRELTEDEVQALESGEITQEDAVEISLGKITLEEIIGRKGEEKPSLQDDDIEKDISISKDEKENTKEKDQKESKEENIKDKDQKESKKENTKNKDQKESKKENTKNKDQKESKKENTKDKDQKESKKENAKNKDSNKSKKDTTQNNIVTSDTKNKIKYENPNTYMIFTNSNNPDHEWRYNWKINSHNYYVEEDEKKFPGNIFLNTDNKETEQNFLNRNNSYVQKDIGNEEIKGESNNSNLADLIAELYILKSSYISKLRGLEAKGKSEYFETPANERTSSWKASMISKYTGEIATWEGECDAKVEGVISKIREELKRTGGDMSVINTIRSTYEKEKQLQKAGYMNTYLN